MSFQHGLSGLDAASKNLDVIGNNVANANTVGFKGSRTQFADVFATSVSSSIGTDIGIGTRVAAVAAEFTQGNIAVTSDPLDLAINGQGFFRMDNNGAISYTRNGQFQLDRNGYIVNSRGDRLTGYPSNAAGAIVTAAPIDLQLTTQGVPPSATTAATVGANLDARAAVIAAPFNLNDATTYNSATSMSVYDSLGNPHTLSVYFAKTAANTWDLYASLDGTQVGAGAAGSLVFQSNGALDTAASTFPSLSVALANGATTPFAFNVDFTGTTQFGSAFGVTQLAQDGYAAGQLTGFSVDDRGVILGRYSNGQSRAQGQVALASFTSPQGLQALGSNAWAETAGSGPALIGAPQSGSLGALQSGAVESSNVDLTAELVEMITAQRVYQANAQTIKTQDSLLQTLVNLR